MASGELKSLLSVMRVCGIIIINSLVNLNPCINYMDHYNHFIFICFKDVQTLLKRYLEPLRHEKFLPREEVFFPHHSLPNLVQFIILFHSQVNSLAENISQIIDFQSSFCCEIQQLIDCEEDFKNISEVNLFQVCCV